MSEHYDFHYQPTGSGAISGQQVLQQTEDAINELGDYVNDNVGGAMDVAQQALETAQNAEQDAQTALDTANSFSSAIQSAQQDASTALSTAQTAQTTATNANATAIQASQDASSAVTTANNASGQVSTLSGTVTTLGQRVTTAEGNIGQNTSDITALTTRVGTAEGNITTLQNDVSIAQGNASSAMATAGTVKQQSYVLRYSSTTLVASSTNSNSLLDNTDNLKVGDKVIDAGGVIYSVTAIDTANSTFTIGTALIDLAQDSDVVHKSGNETIGGIKSFSDDTYITSLNFTNNVASPSSSSSSVMPIINTVTYTSGDTSVVARLNFRVTADGVKAFYPNENNQYALGLQSRKWSEVRAIQYYYGSSDVEFSNKFVTTDTAQTIDSEKTFNNIVPINGVYIGNEPSTTFRTVLLLRSRYDTAGKSGWLVSKFRSNSAQGALSGSDTVFLNFDVLENEVRTNGILRFNLSSWSGNVPGRFSLIPNANVESFLGTTGNKWSTINGLEPSALGMPDLANGIDISSYLTNAGTVTPSEYTPSVNGYICIQISADSPPFIRMYNDYGFDNSVYTERNEVGSTSGGTYTRFASLIFPANKDVKVYIIVMPSTFGVISAKFFPCQGNV